MYTTCLYRYFVNGHSLTTKFIKIKVHNVAFHLHRSFYLSILKSNLQPTQQVVVVLFTEEKPQMISNVKMSI